MFITIITLGLLTTFWACKRPTDGILVSMDMTAVTGSPKYHVLVQLRDAAALNTTPAGASIAVTGQDGGFVTSSAGSKILKIQNGIVDIAIDPKRTPLPNQPISFELSINAPGYLPEVRQIEVDATEFNQNVYVDLINIKNPPPGLELSEANMTLSNGAVASLTKINVEQGTLATVATSAMPNSKKTSSVSGVKVNEVTGPEPEDVPLTVEDGLVTLVFPKGSTFYYKVLDTGTVKYTKSVPKIDTIIHTVNTTNPNATAILPEYRITGYYDVEVKGPKYKKVAYTGEVKIITETVQYNNSEDLKVFPYDPKGVVDFGKTIKLLKKRTARENRMLFDAITVKSGRPATVGYTNEVQFYGKDAKGALFTISPDSTYNWFMSFTLDADKTNPLTSKKIVAGDSVETGIDIKNDTTYRSAVRSVQIGGKTYLRAESQSSCVGFYYEAPFTQAYNLTVSGNIPQAILGIPDKENLAIQANVRMGDYMLYIPYSTTKPLVFSGNIVSRNPITAPQFYFDVSYWWKSLVHRNETTTFNGQIDLFANANIRLNPRVDFEMCIKCTDKKLIITPSQWGYVVMPDDSYWKRFQRSVNLVNGKWATQGLEIGSEYTATGEFLGKNPTYKMKITGTMVRDTALVDCRAIGM